MLSLVELFQYELWVSLLCVGGAIVCLAIGLKTNDKFGKYLMLLAAVIFMGMVLVLISFTTVVHTSITPCAIDHSDSYTIVADSLENIYRSTTPEVSLKLRVNQTRDVTIIYTDYGIMPEIVEAKGSYCPIGSMSGC